MGVPKCYEDSHVTIRTFFLSKKSSREGLIQAPPCFYMLDSFDFIEFPDTSNVYCNCRLATDQNFQILSEYVNATLIPFFTRDSKVIIDNQGLPESGTYMGSLVNKRPLLLEPEMGIEPQTCKL